MSARRTRAVLRLLEREGWDFTRTNGGHYRGEHPEVPGGYLYMASSSGGGRGDLNALAMARRLVRQARQGKVD